MNEEIEKKRLELEERRLSEELRLKEMELALHREQFEAEQKRKGFWAQVLSPLGAAIIAGILGLFGTAFSGLWSARIERQKQQANLLLKLSEESNEEQRARNLLFYAQGGYLEFTDDYTKYLRAKANLKEGVEIPPPIAPGSFEALVDIPANINQGLTAVKPEILTGIFGEVCARTQNCSEITNAGFKSLLVSEDVGPFKVTGLKPAVDALRRIFAEVKQKEPQLYPQIRTLGMLCCRSIRGTTTPSNHSWGTAIDLEIGNSFSPPESGKTQAGILTLYPYFNKEKFFWGAASERKDAIHFEASEELIKEWEDKGLLKSQ